MLTRGQRVPYLFFPILRMVLGGGEEKKHQTQVFTFESDGGDGPKAGGKEKSEGLVV